MRGSKSFPLDFLFFPVFFPVALFFLPFPTRWPRRTGRILPTPENGLILLLRKIFKNRTTVGRTHVPTNVAIGVHESSCETAALQFLALVMLYLVHTRNADLNRSPSRYIVTTNITIGCTCQENRRASISSSHSALTRNC